MTAAIALRSPATGRALHADTPHSLSDGAGERWPVIDDIAYLRVGSEALAAGALQRLDAGDEAAALCLLLAENDRWWDGVPPAEVQLRRLLAQRHALTLRQAMELLGFGRVGTYFAHRWSDPTFVAGLALLDAHWAAPQSAFELACGIGHFLRELGRLGVACIGGDIVFSKLWLARHWVAGPAPALLCFDADATWPFDARVDLAQCHDAFYFLQRKAEVAARLRDCAAGGLVAVSHVHNRDWPNWSQGAAMTLAELRALFPGAVAYDDQALTSAAAVGRVPCGAGPLDAVEAFSLVCGGPAIDAPRAADGPLSRPTEGVRLRRNPLCRDGLPRWPSARYADEYAARATYGCDASLPDEAVMAPAWRDATARRELLDLPERW